ncbi:MAG: glycosyltransferase [Bacteroidia bacterium]
MSEFLLSLLVVTGLIHLFGRVWLLAGFYAIKKEENDRFSSKKADLPSLSVIVAARDEASNLQAFLPGILSQNYPEFEVLVVLDRCEDGSMQVVQELAQEFPFLRYVEIRDKPSGWAGKKWALSQGIAQAHFPFLVFTDADCEVEADWLVSHGRAFASGAKLVLGLGMYRYRPGVLNRLIRYETAHTAFQYLGAAGHHKAYMGVGRNMAYHRSLYDAQSGFASFSESLSGDDDLLVNHADRFVESRGLVRPGSRTWSEPEHEWRNWLRQKGRHFSASARYTGFSKVSLALFHGSQIAFYGLSGFFLVGGGHIWVGLAAYLVYLLGSWYIFGLFAKEIQQNNLIRYYPLLDLAYACYHSLIAPFGLLARPSWQTNQNRKSRKIHSKTASS